ncbi:hypothetical protein [Natrinema versiforme]|uniref:Integrase family protein n=1 Tax=Natrinema versiforme JCM 10478 TaxID=1227496 RepID=L9XZX4_9EURY|nr:hypothetical protein [Natrinema versiforme]ELY67350.1 integrase family protein [Natrinema versiforme JCM 10478]
MDDFYSLQTGFVLHFAGQLGMRQGEIAHLVERWVDLDRNMICIPVHERCIKGRESMGICGSCRQQVKQRVEHNDEMTLRNWPDSKNGGCRS